MSVLWNRVRKKPSSSFFAFLFLLWNIKYLSALWRCSSRRKQLKNKVVLITGGGNGIGKSQAIEFLKRGAVLVLWDINEDVLQSTVSELNETFPESKIYDAVVDVTDRQSVYEVARHTLETCGNVDILINNAGIVSGELLTETPDEKIIRTMRVNVFAHFWTVKAFLPAMMKARSGHIVTIASLSAYVGAPRLVDYTTSKFAVRGFHTALKIELESLGFADQIQTTCICPGHISTELFSGFKSGSMAPSLEPSTVAQEIVAAVENKQDICIIPASATPFVTIFPSILPTCVLRLIGKMSGIYTCMKDFDPSHANKTFALLKK